MTVFYAKSEKGHLAFNRPSEAEMFRYYLEQHPDVRLRIEPFLPESRKQRKYFEGCIIPLITFYQEALDHRQPADCRQVREWVMQEFNGEYKLIGGKSVKVAKSSKGLLAKGLLENVIEWLMENYAPPEEAVNPESYKVWLSTVYPTGIHENYIDYLLSLRKIRR